MRIEHEEEATLNAGAEPPPPPGPVQLRRQFSADAELMMEADVIEKLKDLICGHTPELRAYYDRLDAERGGDGRHSVAEWADGLKAVVQGGQALHWEDYVQHVRPCRARPLLCPVSRSGLLWPDAADDLAASRFGTCDTLLSLQAWSLN